MAKRPSPRSTGTSPGPNQTTRPRRPATSKRTPGRRRINAADRRKAMELVAEPIFYMDAEAFHEPGAQESLFDDAEPVPLPDTAWYHPLLNQNMDCPLLHVLVPFVQVPSYGMIQPVGGCLPPDQGVPGI